MRRILRLTVAWLAALLACAPATGAVDATRLAAIKSATAFIRITTHSGASSGSGFVAHVSGRRALVATNAHVVRHAADGEIEVVFDSGTRSERVLPARTLVEDRASDLAILEVTGAKLPAAAVLAASDDVVETLELYIVGFPFGEAFATNRDTPTVTVGRGTVSSLRLDLNDLTRLLQIDGDINPGNSGGPVISEVGEVIGISVATISETNIGFAIPVRKLSALLAGAVGNLRALQAADRVQLIGDWLDPFDRPFTGRVLFGPEDEVRISSPGRSGRWRAIAGAVRSAPLTLETDGRVRASLALAEDRTWTVQVITERDGVERAQAPVRVAPGALTASIEGPGVLSEDEPRESLGDLGRDADERADAELAEALIDVSGLDELIGRMAEDRALFFGRKSKEQAKESKDEKDVRERLTEILAVGWDRNRLHRHYVETFLSRFERDNARTMIELLKLPAARRMHVDFVSLTTQGEAGLRSAVEEVRRRRKRERLALLERLDEARGLSEAIATASYASTLAIRRVVNELQPAGRRMSADNLERDVSFENRGSRATLELGVKVLLVQYYAQRSDEALEEYVELVETGAFRWFTEQESDAFSSMVTLHFAAAESELRDLLRDVQMDALGVDELEVDDDMTPEQKTQRALDTYGVELVVKYLISKSDGQVTMDDGGPLRLTYGRPRKELITPRSVLADLGRFGIELDQFMRDLENRAVAAGLRDRRLEASPRSAPSRRSPIRSARSQPRSEYRYCMDGCARQHLACRRFANSSSRRCETEMRSCHRTCSR